MFNTWSTTRKHSTCTCVTFLNCSPAKKHGYYATCIPPNCPLAASAHGTGHLHQLLAIHLPEGAANLRSVQNKALRRLNKDATTAYLADALDNPAGSSRRWATEVALRDGFFYGRRSRRGYGGEGRGGGGEEGDTPPLTRTKRSREWIGSAIVHII